MPDVTQQQTKPNGTFTYIVKLPDEGIYRYHPYVREDIQQDMGLYGNLLLTVKAFSDMLVLHTAAISILVLLIGETIFLWSKNPNFSF